jgi:hypothetical protein
VINTRIEEKQFMLDTILNVIGSISIYVYIAIFILVVFSIITISIIRFLRQFAPLMEVAHFIILLLPLFLKLLEYIGNTEVKSRTQLKEDK